MKKQSDLSRLMSYAGNYRYFTYASWVLSAVSALVALVPFVYIWKILRDVLNAAPDYAQAVNIPHYGWMVGQRNILAYIGLGFGVQFTQNLHTLFKFIPHFLSYHELYACLLYTSLGNKLRVSGNLNKAAEPMYMHNEVITQGGISRCKVMYAVCLSLIHIWF